jgi:hypothetical protein
MPKPARSLRRIVAAAGIAGVIALGATFAFPGVGQAQTDETTTTVVEETTETTVPGDDTPSTQTPADESTDEARPQGGDGNCDQAEDTESSET